LIAFRWANILGLFAFALTICVPTAMRGLVLVFFFFVVWWDFIEFYGGLVCFMSPAAFTWNFLFHILYRIYISIYIIYIAHD